MRAHPSEDLIHSFILRPVDVYLQRCRIIDQRHKGTGDWTGDSISGLAYWTYRRLDSHEEPRNQATRWRIMRGLWFIQRCYYSCLFNVCYEFMHLFGYSPEAIVSFFVSFSNIIIMIISFHSLCIYNVSEAAMWFIWDVYARLNWCFNAALPDSIDD